MAKNLKGAVKAGADVFDTITRGAQSVLNTQDVKGAQDVKNTQDVKGAQCVQDTKSAKNAQSQIQYERLNLKIPAHLKEYLTIAAAKESIASKKKTSLTDYLCRLIEKDIDENGTDKGGIGFNEKAEQHHN